MTLPIVYAATRLLASMSKTLPKVRFKLPPDPSTALGLPPGTVSDLDSWVANLNKYVEQKLVGVKPCYDHSPHLYRVCKKLFTSLGFNDSVSSSLTSVYERKLAVFKNFRADTRAKELVSFLTMVFRELLDPPTKETITWTPTQKTNDLFQFVSELLKRRDYPDDYLTFESACLSVYKPTVNADLDEIIQRLRSLHDLIEGWVGYSNTGEPRGMPISRPQLCQVLELYLGLKNYPHTQLDEVNAVENGSLTARWSVDEREFEVDFEKGISVEDDLDASIESDE